MNEMDFVSIGYRVAMSYVPFLFAICFHEFSHGWVAKRFGDNTAERMGRLSLSPMVHADMLGTVVLPLASIIFQIPLFGWAKPVPVDPRNMKDPKNGMFWVALAGPLSNALLALVGTFLLALVAAYMGYKGTGEALSRLLQIFILVNLMLALFNLLPLHPLDGGKVAERFLPYHMNRWLEENQNMTSMILLGLVMLGGFRILAVPVYWMADNLLNLAAILASLLA